MVAAGLGSGLAAIAGVLASLDTGLVPSMGFQALLWAILACVVGGINRVSGAVAGGVILGLINQLGVWEIGTQWQDAVLFTLMIGFLLIRPQGLFGLPLQKATV
jgi:branched-chain amino acid transport system permease protein